LTNFNDAAQWPAISSDGKFVAFLRGPGDGFGSSVDHGEIWFKPLPDGDAIQLTNTKQRKITLAFSPDNTRIFFTQVGEAFTWNTYEIPLFGVQESKLFVSNATGLSWIDRDHLLFSSIKTGVHMALETSSTSRTDQRDIYVPADQVQGMVHRSALSPDRKWVLAVEMDVGWWERCRLIPFDGSNTGKLVGPEGECTSAAWSPDGKWMYFTVNTGNVGSHIWRQRFPDGMPQQLTPAAVSEEEGLVVMPDGKSLITAAGTEESQIWLHDDNFGDKQITSEGYSSLPAFSPDGSRAYYLRRGGGRHGQFSGELWESDVETGSTQPLFPGLLVTHFALSTDGKKIVFATAQSKEPSGIWIAGLDGTQPPHQLTFGGEYRAFFGRTGEILYQSKEDPPHLMRMDEHGKEQRRVIDMNIMGLDSVAPDTSWAVVATTPTGSHGDKNNVAYAVPLNGGEPFAVCERCSYGFGSARIGAPLVLWSMDGKWLYVGTRYFGEGRTGKTVAIPLQGGALPSALRSIRDKSSLLKAPGVRLIPQAEVFPLGGPNRYLFVRASAKTNLFRIYLSQ
jgi:Tol biopolymer transport system component